MLITDVGSCICNSFLVCFCCWSTGNLSVLALDGNFFTSTLPTELNDLKGLIFLNVSTNKLVGNLESFFANASYVYAVDLDFSLNAFTGHVPSKLFESSQLQSVILFSNCFSGTLSDAMCQSQSAQTYILDGLSSAPTCASKLDSTLLTDIFHGYFPKNFMKGSIPECLWSMPNLTTLHLSSNGFKGTIAPIASSLSKLQDINLRGNLLSGTIPAETLMKGNYYQLDFSRNRFSGILPYDMPLDGNITNYVDFSVNRLSGRAPASFVNYVYTGSNSTISHDDYYDYGDDTVPVVATATVNYATGNLFQCSGYLSSGSTTGDNNNDNNDSNVVCGSYDLNLSMLVWGLSCLGASAVIGLCIAFGVRSLSHREQSANAPTKSLFGDSVSYAMHWIRTAQTILRSADTDTAQHNQHQQQQQMRTDSGATTATTFSVSNHLVGANTLHTRAFLLNLRRIFSIFAILTVVYCTVVLLTYVALKVRSGDVTSSPYSTHTRQYGWIATSAYLHTYVPALLVTVYLFSSHKLIALCLFPTVIAHSVFDDSEATAGSQPSQRTDSDAAVSTVKSTRQDEDPNNRNNTFTARWVVPLALQIANIAVILIVNGIYVDLLIMDTLSVTELFFVQVAMSLFKLIWKNTYVTYATKVLEEESRFSLSTITVHQTLMYLFNFIAGPLLATLFTDSTCLYYAVEGQSSVTSSYFIQTVSVESCASLVYNHVANVDYTICNYIEVTQVQTSVLTPPWIYSYQCSSALLNNYIPVLFYVYTLSGLAIPCLQVAAMIAISLRPKELLNSAWLPNWVVRKLVLVPPAYLYVQAESLNNNHSGSSNASIDRRDRENVSNPIVVISTGKAQADDGARSANSMDSADDSSFPGYTTFASKPVSIDSQATGPGGNTLSEKSSQPGLHGDSHVIPTAIALADSSSFQDRPQPERKLVRVHALVSRLLLDLAVMLTFGLASPVLGFAICVSVVASVLRWNLLVGQYLSMLSLMMWPQDLTMAADVSPKSPQYLEHWRSMTMALEQSLAGGFDDISGSVLMVVCTSTIFWGMMVFDMMADSYGDDTGASYAAVFATVLPVLFWAHLYRFPVLTSIVSCCMPSQQLQQKQAQLQKPMNIRPSAARFGGGDDDYADAERGIQLSVDSSVRSSAIFGRTSDVVATAYPGDADGQRYGGRTVSTASNQSGLFNSRFA
jgi:hypothetical protein